jgi:hypothetical protein
MEVFSSAAKETPYKDEFPEPASRQHLKNPDENPVATGGRVLFPAAILKTGTQSLNIAQPNDASFLWLRRIIEL